MKKEKTVTKIEENAEEKEDGGIKSKRALRLLIIFFAVMLAFTIISRVTDALLVPRVQTAAASGGCLSWTIEGEGSVDMKDKSYVSTVAGVHISELCAEPGQKVKANEDLLFYYNTGDLEKLLQQERTELNKLSAELDTVKMNYALDPPACEVFSQPVLIKIYEQQKKVNALRTLIKNEGGVFAPSDGEVVDFELTLGKLTDGKESVSVGQGSATFIGTISATEAQRVNAGDNMQLLSTEGGKNRSVTVESVRLSDDGKTAKVYADVSEINIAAGQKLKLKIVAQSDVFELIVPISALHIKADGSYYVFVISESKTVLGNVTIAKAVDVNVTATSKTHAAIDCSLGSGERVISSISREINDADRVRVYE